MRAKKRLTTVFLIAVVALAALLAGCGRQAADSSDTKGKLTLDHSMKLEYATGFNVDFYKGGYVIFKDSAGKEFLIVPEGKKVPEGLAPAVNVLKAPIKTMYVDSSAMVSLLSSFDGGLDSVRYVTKPAKEWYIDNVKDCMSKGKIEYAGKYSSPDFEKLTAGKTQIAVCTTMVSSHPEMLKKFDDLKIPYFVETSSKEDHPLGRVEWVKLMGVITGKEQAASAAYADQKSKMDAIGAKPKTGKTVAMFFFSTGKDAIYVRNSNDYMVKMIDLAGGSYVPDKLKPGQTGTTQMTFEDFFAGIRDADCIFYLNYARNFTKLDDFAGYNDLMKDFRAVKNGKVWYTHDSFSQSMHAIGDIIKDMNTVLAADGNVDTKYLIRMK